MILYSQEGKFLEQKKDPAIGWVLFELSYNFSLYHIHFVFAFKNIQLLQG